MKNMQPQQRYEIGMIGLGVMGRNLVLNMADQGFSVAGYDNDLAKIEALHQESNVMFAARWISRSPSAAVALFCCQVKKWIGAFAAALGGLDTLVFTGGIGENAPVIRTRICDGLKFIGIELDEKRNTANAGVISAKTSRVAVRVMHTDEESMIVTTVCRVLGLITKKEHGHENEKN